MSMFATGIPAAREEGSRHPPRALSPPCYRLRFNTPRTLLRIYICTLIRSRYMLTGFRLHRHRLLPHSNGE
jgi:hypothetical protein